MAVLLSIWAHRWARKDSSGMPRRASATWPSPATSESAGISVALRPARTWVTKSSRRSAARRALSSLIGITHPVPQRLERPELQLFDRPRAAVQEGSDLGDGSVLAEAHLQHPALVRGQRPHFAEDERPPVQRFEVDLHGNLGRRGPWGVSSQIRYLVGCDPHQPGREGHPSPLEALQVGQGLIEHRGGHVLGLEAGGNPPGHEGVDEVEIAFVEDGEAARVALGLGYQALLVTECPALTIHPNPITPAGARTLRSISNSARSEPLPHAPRHRPGGMGQARAPAERRAG